VAGVFLFGHEEPSMAGFEVYQTGGQQMTNALKSGERVVAESWEDKTELIKKEAFSRPLKGVEYKAQKQGQGMWKKITDEDILVALFD
jgi:hypothetical protein